MSLSSTDGTPSRSISPRTIAITLVISFAAGMAASIGLYVKIKPTEEQAAQMRLNKEIRLELCERISTDLERFKANPHGAQRTALSVLFSEARDAVRAYHRDEGKVATYTDGAERLLSECPEQARKWVGIPSVFPELYEHEKRLISNTAARDVTVATLVPDIPRGEKIGGRRIALVVGNSNYRSGPLLNPRNDAEDVARFLKSTGFQVTESYDQDLQQLRVRLDDFGRSAKTADAVLMYYAGHGIEFRGRNYLVPVDASIQREEEIPQQSYDATALLERLSESKRGASIVIIDACRDTPMFASSRSVKRGIQKMDAPVGSLVAFSAAPGQTASDGVGRNSPYTQAFLRAAGVPGRRIEDVLKETRRLVSEETLGRQVPWYNSSLVGDFFFTSPARDQSATDKDRP